ncbi:hypothetical protein LAWI1_G000596 [Lachnellula willkommii]|uniref:Zn(2)-C6 fungal-type domain-containing protein n=1 Tax=Lachnellula willkommii TaxID=215461 RepID=A0A559MKA2_9HELO|nr:hypothetical protein LAWI1_G000596 [Lachnellula willkommii]
MPFTSFTITQPFLGAPLNFLPALGSQELEQLVDAYVLGNASKQDKLSEVTIDFYNHATVDLNTGALVKTYNVFAFEQSPTESQSSFSPSMYTPSPSASMSFGDSGYGSLSMTPPARKSGGRVSKKPTKKDAKKVAEARLPGFSIMTKDGIDVTSTAGRGTKTKEQREHAHLMRIMKACDACKKKKIRCDPSHSRQSNEMSRTSTTSTAKTLSSSNGGGSSHVNPSPTISIPSLSHESSIASQTNTPPYGAIDDFVLFPEDGSSWNPADISIPEDADLSQFNFDINLDIPMNSGDFDFSNFDPLPQVDFDQLSYLPATPQLGMNQWADLPSPHSRPHPSFSTQDAGQLDANSQDSWINALPDSNSNRRTYPSSFSQESGESSIFSTANVSPQTAGTVADEIWPDGPGDALSSSQFNGRVRQPQSQRSPTDGTASNYSPAEWSRAGSGSGSGSLASSRSSLQTDDLQYWTESTDKTRRGHESLAATLASRPLSSSSSQGHHSDRTAREESLATRVYTGLQHPEGIISQPPINSLQASGTGSLNSDGDFYQPLTSGRNLQLFVPATAGQDRDMHAESRAAPGIESLYDDHLNAQDSRSTPPRPGSHAVPLQGGDKRYGLAFYKDAYEGASFAPGVGSGLAVTAIEDIPSCPLLIKQVELTFANANSVRLLGNTEIYGTGARTSADDQEQQATGDFTSVFQIDTVDRQREVAEQTQPSRVSRSHLTPPTDSADAEQFTAASSLQYVGRFRDESQLEVHAAFSRGSIPRTTVSNVNIVATASVLDTVLHYSKVLVCAAMASALVASVC